MRSSLLVAVYTALCAFASSAFALDKTAATSDLFAANSRRAELTAAILQGTVKPAEALGRLRADKVPFGQSADADSDLALGAMDMGMRLIVQSPKAAEVFFQEAEKALVIALQRTRDTEAAAKADLLRRLALVRISYLNKVAEGKESLAAAEKLEPDAAANRRLRGIFARERGEFLPAESAKTDTPKN